MKEETNEDRRKVKAMIDLLENDKNASYQESAAAIAFWLPFMFDSPKYDIVLKEPQKVASKSHYSAGKIARRNRSANRAFALAAWRDEMLKQYGPETSKNIWPKP